MSESDPSPRPPNLVSLETNHPIWDRFFMIAPMVVIGSLEEDGTYDLAPKHMAMPLGWENYFGFVCTPEHATYRNIQRTGEFTVSFPTTEAVVLTSLAAAPRCGDDSKPSLQALPTFEAESINGRFLRQASLFFECQLHGIYDEFGVNSLIAGRIVAAHIAADALRKMDTDDQQTIAAEPLFAYIAPGRYASIDRSFSFPFPAGFQRTKETNE